MNRNDYINAVDKLEFSGDLAARVRCASREKPRFRSLRAAAIGAVLVCLMVTTAIGAGAVLRQRPTEVVSVGTSALELDNASYMEFSVSDMTEGVNIHYMALNPIQKYHFRHGMLWSGKLGYQRIREDYTLEPAELNRAEVKLDKNGRIYTLNFDYMETEQGIISNHRSVYHKDENGEILLNATDGNSGQWPVYFHLESGTWRDALPDWTAEDFEGRVGYCDPLMGGLLVCTIVDNGQTDSESWMYWIAPGAKEAKILELPGEGKAHVEQGTVYYQNEAGQLYRMKEDFRFEQICQYETMNYIQDGLLTVSVNGKLGILDACTGELYVLEEICAYRWDTAEYTAVRHGNEGTIALIQTQWLHDPERIVLRRLGVLDQETAQLKLLELDQDFDGYQHSWLDENRFAVVYRSDLEQYLCVYEFEE